MQCAWHLHPPHRAQHCRSTEEQTWGMYVPLSHQLKPSTQSQEQQDGKSCHMQTQESWLCGEDCGHVWEDAALGTSKKGTFTLRASGKLKPAGESKLVEGISTRPPRTAGGRGCVDNWEVAQCGLKATNFKCRSCSCEKAWTA